MNFQYTIITGGFFITANNSVRTANPNSYNINPQSIVKETAGEVLHTPENGKVEEIDEGERTIEEGTVSEDSRPVDGTFRFNRCQYVAVYINSGNASGNKVEDSGNIVPQVIHHGGTVITPSNDRLPTYINEGAPPPTRKLKESNTQASNLINYGAEYQATLDQSYRCQGISSNFTLEPHSSMLSPLLPCHMREDSSSYSSVAQSGPPSAPPVGLSSRSRQNNPFLKQFMTIPPEDIPLQTLKEAQTSMSPRNGDNVPATTETTPMQANRKVPAPMTLPGPAFQPFPMNPFLPTHMGLPFNFLSHILQPFPGNGQNIPPNNTSDDGSSSSSQTNLHPCHYRAESPLASNPSLDSDSKRLEHHLHSALAIVVKASGTSSLAEILTPQSQNSLKALNALVPVETPVPSPKTVANDSPACSNSVGKKATTSVKITAKDIQRYENI